MTATDERIKSLEKCITDLRKQHKQQEQSMNDLEQYSRRSHLRIRGLHIQRNESCKTAVARFCTTKLGVTICEDDLDAAHPLPTRSSTLLTSSQQSHYNMLNQENTNIKNRIQDPAPIIVRFHRRDQRDSVIKARSALKGTRITVTEDLTAENQKLLQRLQKATTISSAWSWNGKILYTLKGCRKTYRVGMHDTIPA
jgi:hypothetical protein